MKFLFPKIECAGLRGAKEVVRQQLGYKKKEKQMIKLNDEDKRYLIEGIAKSIAAYTYQVGGPSSYSKSDLLEKLDKMYDLVTSLEKEI